MSVNQEIGDLEPMFLNQRLEESPRIPWKCVSNLADGGHPSEREGCVLGGKGHPGRQLSCVDSEIGEHVGLKMPELDGTKTSITGKERKCQGRPEGLDRQVSWSAGAALALL